MNLNDERADFLRRLDGTRQRIERFIMELQLGLQTWTEADFHRDSVLADMRQFHREVVEAIDSIKKGRPITNRMRAIERRVLARPAEPTATRLNGWRRPQVLKCFRAEAIGCRRRA